jgi:hypothetical protein
MTLRNLGGFFYPCVIRGKASKAKRFLQLKLEKSVKLTPWHKTSFKKHSASEKSGSGH